MFVTSDAWSTSHLSQWISEPAYYIVDCRIFDEFSCGADNMDHYIEQAGKGKSCPLQRKAIIGTLKAFESIKELWSFNNSNKGFQ